MVIEGVATAPEVTTPGVKIELSALFKSASMAQQPEDAEFNT